MARDYYGLLRSSQGAGDAEIKRPIASWPRTAPRRQPRRDGAGPVQGDLGRLRGADRPGESGASSTSAAIRWRTPAWAVAAASRALVDWAMCSGRRFFGGGTASRGPTGRVRPSSDSLLRMRLDLTECATGVTQTGHRRHRRIVRSLPGQGHQRRFAAGVVRHLRRARRGAVRATLAARSES